MAARRTQLVLGMLVPALVSLCARAAEPGAKPYPLLRAFSDELVRLTAEVRPWVVRLDTAHRVAGEDGHLVEHREFGAGVLVDGAGHILTTYHVVENAQTISAQIRDVNSSHPAVIVGTDSKTDLAVLRLTDPPPDLPVARLGASRDLRSGELVLAFGNPEGLFQSASLGIVSGTRRSMGQLVYENFIQTDASINPGCSGGPLVDTDGRVVGLIDMIATEGGGSEGLGFAVPVDTVRVVMQQILERGTVRRGWLGLEVSSPPADAAYPLFDGTRGARVETVLPGGPAAGAGLRAGDVIYRFDGQPVENASRLQSLVAGHPVDSEARLLYGRDGRFFEIRVPIRVPRDGGPELDAPRERMP